MLWRLVLSGNQSESRLEGRCDARRVVFIDIGHLLLVALPGKSGPLDALHNLLHTRLQRLRLNANGDGWYTQAEFLEYYGSTDAWDAAPPPPARRAAWQAGGSMAPASTAPAPWAAPAPAMPMAPAPGARAPSGGPNAEPRAFDAPIGLTPPNSVSTPPEAQPSRHRRTGSDGGGAPGHRRACSGDSSVSAAMLRTPPAAARAPLAEIPPFRRPVGNGEPKSGTESGAETRGGSQRMAAGVAAADADDAADADAADALAARVRADAEARRAKAAAEARASAPQFRALTPAVSCSASTI